MDLNWVGDLPDLAVTERTAIQSIIEAADTIAWS